MLFLCETFVIGGTVDAGLNYVINTKTSVNESS